MCADRPKPTIYLRQLSPHQFANADSAGIRRNRAKVVGQSTDSIREAADAFNRVVIASPAPGWAWLNSQPQATAAAHLANTLSDFFPRGCVLGEMQIRLATTK